MTLQRNQVSPAASAYHNNPPSAPPAPTAGPSSFAPPTPDPPGRVQYPSVYKPSERDASPTRQTVPDQDWWSSNIGRDVKGFHDAKTGKAAFQEARNVPLPGDSQTDKPARPREQFERAVQKKVGSALQIRPQKYARLLLNNSTIRFV